MGPSGSGKTTLLNLIAGLDTPSEGEVWVGNELISGMTEAGLACAVCSGIADLCAGLDAGAGVLMVTEETLIAEGMRQLQAALERQPAWSDVPIIVLTNGDANSTISAYALENLGNVLLLDRPVHIATLVSTVRTALRARMRQYQIREYLLEREQDALERERLYAAEQPLEHPPIPIV